MSEPIIDRPEDNTLPSREGPVNHPENIGKWPRIVRTLGVVGASGALFFGGIEAANANENTPADAEIVLPAVAEPLTLSIPSAGNVENVPILLTGVPWGNDPGQWGGITPREFASLHIRDFLKRPGQIGASFIGAHSNRMPNGQLDKGGNIIDDPEFNDDHALKVGDEAFIQMDNESILKQTVFDLTKYIDEAPGVIEYLPEDQGVGIYTPKAGLWDNGVPEKLDEIARNNGWAVTYLFVSYGGPKSNEWLEGQPNHRKYVGIIALRSEVYTPTANESLDPEKDQVPVPSTDDQDSAILVPSNTPHPTQPEQNTETTTATTPVSEAVQENLDAARKALALQAEELALAEKAAEESNAFSPGYLALYGAMSIVGAGAGYAMDRGGHSKKRGKEG